jgi:hypothetical protein
MKTLEMNECLRGEHAARERDEGEPERREAGDPDEERDDRRWRFAPHRLNAVHGDPDNGKHADREQGHDDRGSDPAGEHTPRRYRRSPPPFEDAALT